jgi:hypothetical protein
MPEHQPKLRIKFAPRSKPCLGYKHQYINGVWGEIIAVCSEIHTERTNAQCGQKVEFVNVKSGGTYSNHWALRGR